MKNTSSTEYRGTCMYPSPFPTDTGARWIPVEEQKGKAWLAEMAGHNAPVEVQPSK